MGCTRPSNDRRCVIAHRNRLGFLSELKALHNSGKEASISGEWQLALHIKPDTKRVHRAYNGRYCTRGTSVPVRPLRTAPAQWPGPISVISLHSSCSLWEHPLCRFVFPFLGNGMLQPFPILILRIAANTHGRAGHSTSPRHAWALCSSTPGFLDAQPVSFPWRKTVALPCSPNLVLS